MGFREWFAGAPIPTETRVVQMPDSISGSDLYRRVQVLEQQVAELRTLLKYTYRQHKIVTDEFGNMSNKEVAPTSITLSRGVVRKIVRHEARDEVVEDEDKEI